MGYRGRAFAVAAAGPRSPHGTALCIPHGRSPVRNTHELCPKCGDARQWCRLADDGRPAGLQAAHPSRIYDLPDFAVHAHDPHLERCGCPCLSLPALSDRAHAADTGKGAYPAMNLSVNGVEVIAGEETPELAAAHELLRQRAVEVGL